MPEIKRLAAVALLVITLIACRRDRADPPLKPGPPPTHLAAVISLPSVDQARRDIIAMADAVEAGAGAGLGALTVPEWAGVSSLDGVDRSAPLHVVVVEPPGAKPGLVLVVRVADREAVRGAVRDREIRFHGGWAAIGHRIDVEEVAPWALNELVARPPPRAITAQLTPPILVRTHDPLRISADPPGGIAGADDAESAAFSLLGWGMFAAFAQASAATFTLEPSARGLDLAITLTPTPGTTLDSVLQAQRPSSFELLSRVPASDPLIAVGGQIALGPLRGRALDLLQRWMAEVAGVQPTAADLAAVESLLAATTGDFASVIDSDAPWHVAGLYRIVDPAVAAPHAAKVASMYGLTTTLPINGVSFAALVGGPQPPLLHGAWEDIGAVVLAADGQAVAAELVARTRVASVESTLPPAFAARIEQAKADGDSFLVVSQEEGTMTSFAVGAAGGTLNVRLSAGVTRLKALSELAVAGFMGVQ